MRMRMGMKMGMGMRMGRVSPAAKAYPPLTASLFPFLGEFTAEGISLCRQGKAL